MWDTDSGRCLKQIRTFNFSPVAGTFSPDGRLASTAYGDAFKTIDLWDMIEGRLLRRYPGVGALGVVFSPDSRYLASFGPDGRIRGMDTSADGVQWQSPQIGKITCLAYFATGQTLAAGQKAVRWFRWTRGPAKSCFGSGCMMDRLSINVFTG